MRELAVAIQNENDKVSIIETINSINNAKFKNVFVQWYDDNWEYSQEKQIEMCKQLEMIMLEYVLMQGITMFILMMNLILNFLRIEFLQYTYMIMINQTICTYYLLMGQ